MPTYASLPQQDIESIAADLLSRELDPGPRVRLLRDVLQVSLDDTRYVQARRDLQGSRWVHQLDAAQEADGSWGRFHTQDTKKKTRFPTCEFAIMRGLTLVWTSPRLSFPGPPSICGESCAARPGGRTTMKSTSIL